MSVTSLREITVGVSDLKARTAQFQSGCGLSVLASGALTSVTAHRIFDSHGTLHSTVLGRSDVAGSPRIRLVEISRGPEARVAGIESGGPLGIGFTTRGIENVHARLEQSGLRFVSPPILLNPMGAAEDEGASGSPRRFETFGRAADGDFIVLIERVNAETPYGSLTKDCSEPLHASFIVTNLETSIHFMKDVLEHEVLLQDTCVGPPFDALLGMPADVSFRFAMPHRPGFTTGRCVFLEFDNKAQPMAHIPSLSRGLCRLRYDTTDLHATLARVPGGGGSLVRGPSGVDDPVLGAGLVAVVRAPFGVAIELWQT